jgi:cell wall-associated NlpC family hydrolase
VNSGSYADISGVIVRALVLLLAVASGACAARGGVPAAPAPRGAGGVPRPFPGASLPPVAAEAPDRVEAPVEPETPPSAGAPAPAGASGDLIGTALAFIGVPYRNGGSDPSGFDCSGFVQWVFGRHGLALPREVRDQYEAGRQIDLDEVREGDLLFFETVARGASHVGIALGNGRFVHAPSSRGVVRVEPYTASYWARRLVGARRVGDVNEEREAVKPRVFPGSIRSAR